MIGFALLTALATLAIGLAATVGPRLLPTVRLQLIGLALLAVLLRLHGPIFVCGRIDPPLW